LISLNKKNNKRRHQENPLEKKSIIGSFTFTLFRYLFKVVFFSFFLPTVCDISVIIIILRRYY